MRIEYNESPQWIRKIEFCCEKASDNVLIDSNPLVLLAVDKIYNINSLHEGFGLFANGVEVKFCMFCGAMVEMIKVKYNCEPGTITV